MWWEAVCCDEVEVLSGTRMQGLAPIMVGGILRVVSNEHQNRYYHIFWKERLTLEHILCRLFALVSSYTYKLCAVDAPSLHIRYKAIEERA
jgi:hypothetical protein